jgi:hypothetical protein
LLLQAIARKTQHAGRTTLSVSSTHGEQQTARQAYLRIARFFRAVGRSATLVSHPERGTAKISARPTTDPARTPAAGLTPPAMVANRDANCRRAWDIGWLSAASKLAIVGAQPQLRFPGDLADRLRLLLPFKRLFEAVLGRAGGAVVVATVDHTLMRGSKPHDR